MNNPDYEYFQSNYKYDYQFELHLMKRNQKEILYDLDLYTTFIKGEEPKLKDLYRQHVITVERPNKKEIVEKHEDNC